VIIIKDKVVIIIKEEVINFDPLTPSFLPKNPKKVYLEFADHLASKIP
jgi:hypothetical protein